MTAAPADREHPDQREAIIDARLGELTLRFGARLSAEERAVVRNRIGRSMALSAALRAVPLTNADEPEIVFTPVRGES
ncbi:MAG: hypothetical protein ACR2OO_07360 [Thermomicrobiales bacterium]